MRNIILATAVSIAGSTSASGVRVYTLGQGRENELEVGGGAEYVLLHNAKNARILLYCLYLNNIILNVTTISILFYILDLQTLF